MTPSKKTEKPEKSTVKPSVRPRAERLEKAGPPKAAVYSALGKQVATVALPPELFGAPWKADLVHQVVTALAANARLNRAHTKDRSEVAGGGKKPWKQKGTGRARHGSIRSPLWRGGGITFGPRNTRDYREKINKKMRRGALAAVLSRKAKDEEVILVDTLAFAAPKTVEAKRALEALAQATGALALSAKKRNAALIAFSHYDVGAIKSFRNIGNVATEEARNLNPLSVLAHKYLIIENPEASFKALSARLAK